jgi:hypothetical protein
MSNIYSIMGLISTIFLSLPIVLILFFKLLGHKNFIALCIYYLGAFIYNLLSLEYISTSPDFTYKFGLINNLIDAPVMLFFMTYFCTSKTVKRKLYISIISLIVFEIFVLSINGLNTDTTAITAGPGLFCVMLFSLYFFLQQTKRAIRSVKANGKALMAGSLIIAYSCYIFLYLMFYVFKTHVENGVVNPLAVSNVYLLYYLGTILSTSILCAGLIYESKRVKNLFETKVVRKELHIIYKNEKKDAPAKARTSFDDFDPSEFFKSNTYPQ